MKESCRWCMLGLELGDTRPDFGGTAGGMSFDCTDVIEAGDGLVKMVEGEAEMMEQLGEVGLNGFWNSRSSLGRSSLRCPTPAGSVASCLTAGYVGRATHDTMASPNGLSLQPPGVLLDRSCPLW